jgi:hypothetical protein
MEAVSSAEMSRNFYQNQVRHITEDLTLPEKLKSHFYNRWGKDFRIIYFATFANGVMHNVQKEEEEGISMF